MKHSKGTRAAAIAATVLAAGIVAAGPANAATAAPRAAAPQCSVADLHANILKAAAAETPDAVIATRTQGIQADFAKS